MDRAFVEDLCRRMAHACAEYDCKITYDSQGGDLSVGPWVMRLHDEEGESVNSALISDAGTDPFGRQLIKMVIDEDNPYTVFVSAVPKAVFSLLYA